MAESFSRPQSGEITIQVDHSAVEMEERKRADAEKARADAAELKIKEYEAKEAEKLALEQNAIQEEERAKAERKRPTGVCSPTNMGAKTSKWRGFEESNKGMQEMGEFMARNAKSDEEISQIYDALTAKAFNEFSEGRERLELATPLSDYAKGKMEWKIKPNTVSNDSIDREIEAAWK